MSDVAGKGKRVAVVGGGISGLAAAHRLVELDRSLKITVFEASDHLGGVLQTERSEGFCIELGPDSFITQFPWALDLCRRIGFDGELICTNETHRQTYVVGDGKLRRLPEGLAVMAPCRVWPMLTSPVLSIRGKLRLGWEYFVPARRDGGDESLACFARRRLGREGFERLVQPLVSGIYMSDPERLSMRAALPRFFEMEQQHGSLIRAGRRELKARKENKSTATGPRYSMFIAPREGMASLVAALARRLPPDAVQINSAVGHLAERAGGGWRLSPANGAGRRSESEDFDAVVVATSAREAARLLSGTSDSLAAELGGIGLAGCVIVVAAYERGQISHPLDGFGFVVPQCENRDLIACTFSSVKYAERAPEGSVLLRAFLGGACRPDLLDLPDDALQRTVADELRQLIGLSGEPTLLRIARWPGIMPQYEVGHLDRVERIENSVARLPNFQLAGNAYRGIGIPHCIHSGEQAAEQIVNGLEK